jgi:hypothetical protein
MRLSPLQLCLSSTATGRTALAAEHLYESGQ